MRSRTWIDPLGPSRRGCPFLEKPARCTLPTTEKASILAEACPGSGESYWAHKKRSSTRRSSQASTASLRYRT